ncbi:MAG: hypothetical protein L3V56_01725 [Candidatus Magnetoovum sp. WYHC-5]|nr:hypothetical protein [Candidatus Magnetoovum sp. WYHC-5]
MFEQTQKIVDLINTIDDNVVGIRFLKEYAVIVFHAEVELTLQEIFFRKTIFDCTKDGFKRNLSSTLTGKLSFQDIGGKFKTDIWRKIERETETVLKKNLNDPTFHIEQLKRDYNELITARNELAHRTTTLYLIDVNNIQKCIDFMKALIANMEKFSQTA